jgi:DNA polymerase III subunit gamma/tau
MSYLVFALKYRPQRFDEVTGQSHVSRTLANALRTGRAAQAYLFSGPRGVGKTSMARILAKALNCEKGTPDEPCNECSACREVTSGRAMDVIEIDGASNRGIDDIRELREAVRYAPAILTRKVYIIDEVHMLTTDAFNALLKTLEEPPRHVVFILATTEPLKVPQTILSRCQRFDFARLSTRDSAERLRFICEREGIQAGDEALFLIARKGEGSMRDALTLLDQVVATGLSELTPEGVRAALGIAGRELFFEWSEAIKTRDAARALRSLGGAIESGSNLQELADEFLAHLRNLLLVATDPTLSDLCEATDEEREGYIRQAAGMAQADLLRYCRLCLETAGVMRRSGYPRAHLEVALAEMCTLPTALDLRRFIEVARGKFGNVEAPGSAGPLIPGPPTPAPPTPAPRGATLPSAGRPGTVPGVQPGTAKLPPSPIAPPDSTLESAGEPETGVGAIVGATPWATILGALSTQKPAIAALLNGSAPVGEEGRMLRVQVPALSPFNREQLDRKTNRTVILDLIEKHFGKPLGIRYEEGPGARGGPVGVAPVPADAGGAFAAGSSDDSASSAAPRKRGSREAASPEQIQKIADLFGGDVIGPA